MLHIKQTAQNKVSLNTFCGPSPGHKTSSSLDALMMPSKDWRDKMAST